MRKALEKAIEILGGQTLAAAALGVPQPTISYWLNQSKQGVSPTYCSKIEKATRGKVRKEELRPDVFEAKNG